MLSYALRDLWPLTFSPRRASDVGVPLDHRSLGARLNVTIALTLSLLLAGAIYLSCEYFVNGVEWVGRQLKLSATTTGTVLAAFGTALPESAVTFAAVVFGRDAAPWVNSNQSHTRSAGRPGCSIIPCWPRE